ncbi:MAG: hypothetical protein JWP91_3427 [Fibrobacteres bacterium]|nr:hypothetical protein [Fibrobacterota bacterium]
MRVLFVSSLALFKGARFGGSKRLYYLARQLEGLVDLHVICFDGSRELPAGEAFPREFRKYLYLPTPPSPKGLSRFAFLPGIPDVLSRNKAALEAFLGGAEFDVLLLAYPIALSILDADPPVKARRVVYMEDDLLLENYRKSAVAAKSLPGRIMGRIRYRQGRAFFSRQMAKVGLFVCISRAESELVRELFPGLGTGILGYGIPLEEYPLMPPPGDRRVLGFIGNYDHAPNRDALEWLIGELLPVMRGRDPGIRLVVAGRNLPAGLKARCIPDAGITLYEDVASLGDFYRDIGIFINPIRQGRGMRTKLVEAAAFGRPILTTALGAEGLENLRMDLCEAAEGFSSSHRALAGADAYGRAVAHNREAVEREYSLETVGRKLAGFLADAPKAGA